MENFMNLINMNNFIYWIILEIIFNFLFSFINLLTFKILLKIDIKKKRDILNIAICGFTKSIIFAFVPFPYFVVVNIILETIIFKFMYKERIENVIIAELINYTFHFMIEAIFSFIFLKLMKNYENYNQAICSCKYLICLYSCIASIRALLYILIKNKSITLNIPDSLTIKDRNIILVASMINFIIIYSVSIEILYHINLLSFRVIILYVVAMVMYFYSIIQNILKTIIIQDNSLHISNLESYNKSLSIMYDNIRGFKHDFSNLVQALDGYAKTNDLDGIKKMTGSIINDCKSINNMEILNSSLIKNPAIYSIITSKYYLAQKENVDMNIDISVDLSETNICSYEVSRILAILLDNAIEAAKECDEKIVNLRCVMDPKVKRKLIIIENTYKQKDIDIDRIFEKGYTAKEDTKNEHGLGLWTVKKTLNKLENISLFTTKGEHFCQQLEIYC